MHEHIAGSKNGFYIVFTQCVYVSILIFTLIYSLIKLTTKIIKYEFLDTISLFFVGIFMFHIFMWEIQPRYALPAIFAILPVAAKGLQCTDEFIYSQGNLIRLRRNSILSLLILMSLGIVANRDHLVRHNVSPRITVLSQVPPFHMYQPITIYQRSSIKENVNVPYNFKKINVIYWAPSISLSSQNKLKLSIYGKNGALVSNGNKVKKQGKYTLVITNMTDKPVKIAVTALPQMDVLQQPIEHTNNNYLIFNVTY